MALDWIVLIYTVPSQPSRKRAYVWRELKRLGAVYLRDGVALLPRRPDLEAQLRAMVARIVEYEGTPHLLLSPEFTGEKVEDLVQLFQHDRREEYRELHRACVRFLRDVLEEVDAEDFGFPDVDNLDSELGRLRRWQEQIQLRDYFQAPGREQIEAIMEKCTRAFEQFTHTASERADAGEAAEERDDVFERLGGSSVASGAVPDDYPL
jgi:hypothetical protein